MSFVPLLRVTGAGQLCGSHCTWWPCLSERLVLAWPAPSCISVAFLEPGPHFLLPALFHEIQMLGTVSGCGSLFKTLPWGTFHLLLLACLLDSMVLPVYSEFQNDKQLPSFCFSSFF